MELSPDFSFQPLPALAHEITQPFPQVASPLGPLAPLAGKWTGHGMNVIWRPNHTPPDQDRFLELNLTSDQIEFSEISGPIPNRGLLQPDINMFGLTYLNQISDTNVGAGLHIEPGIWAAVPATTDPRRRHGQHGLPEGGHRRAERDRGLSHRHLLAGDPAGAVGSDAVAVHPDRSA